MADLSYEYLKMLRRAAEDARDACNRHYGPFVDAVAHPLNILALLDMASREQTSERVFGIIDPDYAAAFTKARIAAWQHGYAITLHGSFTRDLDLVAVPWTDNACDVEILVAAIEYRTGLKRQGPPSDKPHGRKAVSLLFPAFEDPRWIDLSILPRAPVQEVATA